MPPLASMYIDKLLQRHSLILIKTIFHVNRVFDDKDKRLVIDYIGIKNDMVVIQKYVSTQESSID